MALTNNTTIKPIGSDAMAKAIEADPSKLQAYWDANPDALKAATQSNPEAFTLSGLKQGAQQTTTSQPAQTSSLSNIGTMSTTSVQPGAQTAPATTQTTQTVIDPFKALESGGMIDQVGLIRLLHFSPDEVQRKIISGEIQLTQAASQHFYDNIMKNTAKQQERLNSPSPAAQSYAERYLNDPLNQGVVDYHLNTYGNTTGSGSGTGGTTQPPSGGGQQPGTQPPSGGGQTGGGSYYPPASGGGTGGGTYQPPSGGGSGGGTYQPPSGGTGGAGQPPASGGGTYQGGNTAAQSPQWNESDYGWFQNNLSGRTFDSLHPNGQRAMLDILEAGLQNGRYTWGDLDGNSALRAAYIQRFGDPFEGLRGADQNTVNPGGNVQGQWNQETGGAHQAGAMTPMEVAQAEAAAAAQNDREVGNQELASWQLNDLLATGSPLMTLARQQAADQAERAGLRNSSLAAGAAQAAMADRMTPLAQQNAATYADAASQNQGLESQRREANAGREQQTNLYNTDAQNTASRQEFDAEMQRRLSNAGMSNELMNQDRQRDYGYNLQQLAGDQDIAKQRMASQTATDIANIEGQYKMLISENDTAARMFDASYRAIAQVIGNHEIRGDEAREKANYLIGLLETQMEALLAFENLDFGRAGGSGNAFQSGTAGTGGTGTVNYSSLPPAVQQWINSLQSGQYVPPSYS